VNDVFEANLPNIKKIYDSHLSQIHKAMDLKDCNKLCMEVSPIGCTEKEVGFAYGMSKMTVVNEKANSKQYSNFSLVEFLEFIGRMAMLRFKHSSEEMQA
jgi:hypothetical protein